MDFAEVILRGGVIALLIAGAVADLRTRRIPNVLTFGGAIAGLLANVAFFRFAGISTSLMGWALGAALLLIPFMLRAMGGGDVKLLAAVGAWGGPQLVLATLLYAALAGCLIALAWLVIRGHSIGLIRPFVSGLLAAVGNLLFHFWPRALVLTTIASQQGGGGNGVLRSARIPYGPALAIGGIAALVLQGIAR